MIVSLFHCQILNVVVKNHTATCILCHWIGTAEVLIGLFGGLSCGGTIVDIIISHQPSSAEPLRVLAK